MATSSRDHAIKQDNEDPLSSLRKEFLIPSIDSLAATTLHQSSSSDEARQNDHSPESTYLCGNSLGLQPVRTQRYLADYLTTWATKGVYGHFKPLSDSPLPPFVDIDEDVKADMATLVGSGREEVAVMQTLTMNLHAMMLSFYRPTQGRWKIVLEGKAFPSDHVCIS